MERLSQRETVSFSGLVERLRPHNIDAAIPPINGSRQERGVAGNLGGSEAAGLVRAINANLAVPCHYEMFSFNTATPDEFKAAAATLGQRVRVLRAGERCTVEKPVSEVAPSR